MTSVNSAWDSVTEAVGVAYIVTDISIDSIVKDRSSTLETSMASDGSLGFGWMDVGNIFQELSLKTEQTDVVIQEAIVTAPNFPRMYNLENGTFLGFLAKPLHLFRADMWNIKYENCRLVDPSQRTIFNVLEYGPKSFTVNKGFVSVTHDTSYWPNDGNLTSLHSSTLIIHDAESNTTFVQYIQ